MRLSWQPVWDLDTTLSKIVGWHKAWIDQQNMRECTLAEIREYMTVRVGIN
jgi:CDP-glucose 4,6-dehydratase